MNKNLVEIMSMAVDARMEWRKDGRPFGGDRVASAYEHAFEKLAPEIHPGVSDDRLWTVYVRAAEKDLGIETPEDMYG